jgi:hypothetical protein
MDMTSFLRILRHKDQCSTANLVFGLSLITSHRALPKLACGLGR